MKYYDQNVAIVMDFLENHNYGSTSVCQHKRCYKLLPELCIKVTLNTF